MKKILLGILVIAIPLILFFYFAKGDVRFAIPFTKDTQPLVFFHEDVPLRVEIADSPTERTRGLSGRESLAPTTGLLFIFNESDYHGIWMKEMRIPIDIIWVSDAFRVVHIEHNVLPESYPEVFEPSVPARFVIETNANYADSFNIRVGDAVKLPRQAIPEDLQE